MPDSRPHVLVTVMTFYPYKKKKLFYAIVDGHVHSSHGGLLGRGVVILFSYATKLIRLSVKMSIIRHKFIIIKTLPLTFGIVI